MDYTFSIKEDMIKVSDHLYITEEVIPKATSDMQGNKIEIPYHKPSNTFVRKTYMNPKKKSKSLTQQNVLNNIIKNNNEDFLKRKLNKGNEVVCLDEESDDDNNDIEIQNDDENIPDGNTIHAKLERNIADNSWTLKVRRVPGPIPDSSDEPVSRPHFNFNNEKNQMSWHESLAQFGAMSGGDYQEDDVEEDDDMVDDAGVYYNPHKALKINENIFPQGDDDARFSNSNAYHEELRSEFKAEPELNDEYVPYTKSIEFSQNILKTNMLNTNSEIHIKQELDLEQNVNNINHQHTTFETSIKIEPPDWSEIKKEDLFSETPQTTIQNTGSELIQIKQEPSTSSSDIVTTEYVTEIKQEPELDISEVPSINFKSVEVTEIPQTSFSTLAEIKQEVDDDDDVSKNITGEILLDVNVIPRTTHVPRIKVYRGKQPTASQTLANRIKGKLHQNIKLECVFCAKDTELTCTPTTRADEEKKFFTTHIIDHLPILSNLRRLNHTEVIEMVYEVMQKYILCPSCDTNINFCSISQHFITNPECANIGFQCKNSNTCNKTLTCKEILAKRVLSYSHPLKCQYCNVSFYTMSIYNSHLFEKHPKILNRKKLFYDCPRPRILNLKTCVCYICSSIMNDYLLLTHVWSHYMQLRDAKEHSFECKKCESLK